ncbi:MAG: P-II family nitrogen regulator [Pseudomonadota bacterium]
MKLITAIIKPAKLDEVVDALRAQAVTGMTVTEVKGYGRQKGQTEVYRGQEYTIHLLPKVKVEVAADEGQVGMIVDTIQQVANTGKIGDGKIFVMDLEQAVRIRTGETDANAISS